MLITKKWQNGRSNWEKTGSIKVKDFLKVRKFQLGSLSLRITNKHEGAYFAFLPGKIRLTEPKTKKGQLLPSWPNETTVVIQNEQKYLNKNSCWLHSESYFFF